MLRNDAIVLMSRFGNDTLVVKIGAVLVSIESVMAESGCVVLVPDPEELQTAFGSLAAFNATDV